MGNYWIELSPNIGKVLVKDKAEEDQVRADFEKNQKKAEAEAAAVAEQDRRDRENATLAEAAIIKADRKANT